MSHGSATFAYIGIIYRDYMGGLYGDYRGYIGIMESKMETTVVYNKGNTRAFCAPSLIGVSRE